MTVPHFLGSNACVVPPGMAVPLPVEREADLPPAGVTVSWTSFVDLAMGWSFVPNRSFWALVKLRSDAVQVNFVAGPSVPSGMAVSLPGGYLESVTILDVPKAWALVQALRAQYVVERLAGDRDG